MSTCAHERCPCSCMASVMPALYKGEGVSVDRGVLLHDPLEPFRVAKSHMGQCSLFMSSDGVSKGFPLGPLPKVFKGKQAARGLQGKFLVFLST